MTPPRNRAIEDGILRQVSPSQVTTFLACPSKWFLEKVVGIPQPPMEHLEQGEHMHAQMEGWLLHGTPPDHPSCLAATLTPGVPTRDDSPIVEEPKSYELGLEAAGVRMRGRLDVLLPPRDGVVRVVDWKSTASWRYIKTPDELARNTQGIVYLKYAFSRAPEAKRGTFAHVYLRTKTGSGCKVVRTDELERSYVDEQYRVIESVVEKMKVAARAVDTQEVGYNLEECDKYRGCPYRTVCPHANVSVLDQLDRHGKENDMGLFDVLKKQSAPPPAINPPDAAPPVKEEAPPPVKEEAPVAPTPETGAVTPETPAPDKATTRIATPLSPPPAPPEPAAEVPAEAPKKRRGRPAGSKNRAKDAVPPAAPPPAEPVIEASEGRPDFSCTDLPPPPAPLVLLIDCLQVVGSGTVQNLEAEIAERNASLLQYLKEKYPNDVPENAVDLREVSFGKGTAALAASFRLRPITGMWQCSSRGLAGSVIDVLIGQASLVVRGVA